MSFTRKFNLLKSFLKYSSYDFSICKIYQVLELKKLNLKDKTVEFGSNNYKESLIKFNKKNSSNIYFSNIFKKKSKNYLSLNLEKKNSVKKKFNNILAFNVLEHIHDDSNALDEFKKILKKKGKVYISTPFLYRYHAAPKDYKRYTLDYFDKILKKKKFKVKKKLSLGSGPFLASYSMMFDYIKKIPFLRYPLVLICYLFDNFLTIFHKHGVNNLYPICIVIVAEK